MVEAGLVTLREFGTKSFGEAMQPAIDLADGFPLDEVRANILVGRGPLSAAVADLGKVFLPNGRAAAGRARSSASPTWRARCGRWPRWRRRRWPPGASRAKAIDAVRDYFYRGDIAHRIDQFSKANDGLLRYEDMAAFKLEPEEPVSTTFHGYTVYKPGFWSQGPSLIEALNILEGFNLADMRLNSANYIHTLVEALKLAYADRDTYYGDPKFVKIPSEQAALEGVRRRAAEADRQRGLARIPARAMSRRTRPSIPSTRTSCKRKIDDTCWRRTPPAWTPSTRTASRFRSRPRARGCRR